MNEIEIYHYTLRKEVLKEQAVNVFNDLVRYMCKHNLSEKEDTEYSNLFWELSKFKNNIIKDENDNDTIFDGIKKQITVFSRRVDELVKID